MSSIVFLKPESKDHLLSPVFIEVEECFDEIKEQINSDDYIELKPIELEIEGLCLDKILIHKKDILYLSERK